MNSAMKWLLVAAGSLLMPAISPQAVRYESIPEENTILCDDSDAIVMQEYLRRVRDSLTKQKPRTAAAELRRVGSLAGRAADSTAGETRDVLKTIQSQALKLAYALESGSDSAVRQTREFAMRTENFLEGEWTMLEAKQALVRGDTETAKVLLTVAAQQMERRAQRAPKGRGTKFEGLASDIRYLLKERDALKSSDAGRRIADLIKATHDLASTEPARGKSTTTETFPAYSAYSSEGTSSYGKDAYGTDRSWSSKSYDAESYGSRSGESKTSRPGPKKKPAREKKDSLPTRPYTTESYASPSIESRSEDSSTSKTEPYESTPSDTETSSSRSSDSKPSDAEQDNAEF